MKRVFTTCGLNTYKEYCETKEGVNTKTVEKLYKDFGDIYNIEFKEWWNKRGAELFCEQVDLQRVEEISNVEEFRKHKSDNVLTLAIPLNKPKVWVESQIKTEVEKRRNKLGATSRMGVSTAKYPIHTNPKIEALKMRVGCVGLIQRGQPFIRSMCV